MYYGTRKSRLNNKRAGVAGQKETHGRDISRQGDIKTFVVNPNVRFVCLYCKTNKYITRDRCDECGGDGKTTCMPVIAFQALSKELKLEAIKSARQKNILAFRKQH
jgi:hypothetical protein